ncbi:CPBP family intramembrane glutamic endopeptidase [Tsuneonella sp. HG094]
MTSSQDREVSRPVVLSVLAIQACVLTAIAAFLWHWSGRPLAGFLDLEWRSALHGAAFGLAMIGLVGTAFRLRPDFLEWTARLQAQVGQVLGRTISLPVVILISLCAGIGEEALFRGGLMPLASDTIGAPLAVIATSLAFALFHVAKPPIAAMLFVIGLVFAAVFWFTGSLMTVIVGHVVYDIWAIVALHRELARLELLPNPTRAD